MTTRLEQHAHRCYVRIRGHHLGPQSQEVRHHVVCVHVRIYGRLYMRVYMRVYMGVYMAHGTAAAPRDVYKCAGTASRRASARRRGIMATAATFAPAAQKEWENADNSENPDWADCQRGLRPPGRRA
jgi:hypothetical protein